MRIGVDLGGTKIEGVVLDSAGTIVLRERVPTPAGDAAAVVAAVVGLVRRLEEVAGTTATVGIGTPGSLSPRTGLLRNSNTTCLNGRPLDRELSAALGREVRVGNDANCFALSEARDGAGRGHAVVLGLIVGTGTGSGIVAHGRVLTGANGIAGEWGHAPLPWARPDERPGPECYCGRRGCIETWLSGPGIARDHAAHGGDAIDAPEIARRAAAADAASTATLERHVGRFARALAPCIDLLDPDVVVIGGGVGRLAGLCERLAELLPEHVIGGEVATPILLPVHGDSSGVRGAAWLWDAA